MRGRSEVPRALPLDRKIKIYLVSSPGHAATYTGRHDIFQQIPDEALGARAAARREREQLRRRAKMFGGENVLR